MLISVNAGHSKYVEGMNGYLSENDETIKVADATAKWLKAAGHDARLAPNEGRSVREYLREEYGHANSIHADLAVSHHFNAGRGTGVEVYTSPYASKSTKVLAAKISRELAQALGLRNRGAKEHKLAFVMNTKCPAVLIEVCFGDTKQDVEAYHRLTADGVGKAIAEAINGAPIQGETQPQAAQEQPAVLKTGWVHDDAGNTYLYKEDGKLFKGWRKVDAGDHVALQFFDFDDGHMYKNCTIKAAQFDDYGNMSPIVD